MRFSISITLCLIVLLSLFNTRTTAQSYNFINYDIGDGLVHDRVLDMAEDRYGNLWMATLQGGLSRFNGISFKNYTVRDGLPSNYVRDILFDGDGNLWAATALGISMYDGNTFKNYIINDENEVSNSINVMAEGEDHIWFSAPDGGLGSINKKTGQLKFVEVNQNFKNDKVIALHVAENGVIWFISVINGLHKYDGKEIINVINNGDFKGFLLSISVDDNGRFWLGTNKGLLAFDPTKKKDTGSLFDPLEGIFIKHALVGDSSDFWALSAFGMIKIEGGQYKTIGKKQGFSDARVNVIYEDREGSLWVGTDGEGIYKLTNETFTHFNQGHGLNSNPIAAISNDSYGNYYFGTYGGGVDKFDGTSFTNISSEGGLLNSYISCTVADKQGNIWFGTRGSGIYKYDGQKFQSLNVNDGLIYNTVRCLFNDSENNLWIGTANGLSKYDGKSFLNLTTNSGLPGNTIWNFQEVKPGKILVVTREGFIYLDKQGVKDRFYKDDIFNKRINIALEDDKNNYWIGYSGHGVLKYNKISGQKSFYTTQDGLTSDLIYNLLFDDDGNLIVGSERGVDKLYLNEEGLVTRIKSFGEVEGFEDIQTIPNATHKDDKGDIWFGTSEGVYRYQPSKEEINEIEPITYISDLRLFYSEVDWSNYTDSLNSWFSLPVKLKLPYDQNSLMIEYFGNSLINPEEVTYKFRLKGLERDWSPTTKKTEAVYTNLSPGSYTFEVMAANSDGVWTQSPAQFSFEIIPPFWLETWFFATVLVLFLIALKLTNDYRVRSKLHKVLTIERIRAEELTKVRKKMARDFHDNMGNQLASITVFANLISLKLKDKSDDVNELLQNIEKHTKSLFNGTKDFIWSIDPESDNLTEIFTYIKDFGEELYEKVSVDFYSETIGLQDQKATVPSGYSRQLVLIFKEAMTNVLKHANASEVYFVLKLKGNEFVIELKDNGQGLNTEKIGKGQGFKNMRSRASQINCQLDVQSNPQKGGTIITLKGKFESDQTSRKMKVF